MKIALAQINPTVGDFCGNCRQIVAKAKEAGAQGAELTIFSEMCLLGYPARDLLEKPSFLDAQERALHQLCLDLKGFPALVGCVQRRIKREGKALFNTCALINQGQLQALGHKCLLPAYDVFDEDRYFEPAEAPAVAEFQGLKLGLAICEDYWNDKDFWTTERKYPCDPIEKLVNRGAEVLISLNASPYALGKQKAKEAMLCALAKKHRLPLLYANQVGGNDDLLFDGRSLAIDAQGKIVARGPAFEEALTIVECCAAGTLLPVETSIPPQPPLGKGGRTMVEPELCAEEEVYRALVMGTRDYARKCGFKSAVVGLSGGIDSAFVVVIAAEAFGAKNVTGVGLPSRFNAAASLTDAEELAWRLGINFQVAPIQELAEAFRKSLTPVFAGLKEDVTEENIQARIRGVILMAFSNKFGHLLLTTGNKSEVATGYCTLYGDMAGGLAVISDVYKTMVYRVCRWLNARTPRKPPIPESCITKAPSAELRFNQTDQDTLPPYDILDGILKAAIEEMKSAEAIIALGYERAVVRKVLRMLDLSEYKRRQAAPGLKITAKAFGTGRRMPIAQRFQEEC
jgi:NAD+ synthase/NAD+ synthase (glutamine-hydrolysing)